VPVKEAVMPKEQSKPKYWRYAFSESHFNSVTSEYEFITEHKFLIEAPDLSAAQFTADNKTMGWLKDAALYDDGCIYDSPDQQTRIEKGEIFEITREAFLDELLNDSFLKYEKPGTPRQTVEDIVKDCLVQRLSGLPDECLGQLVKAIADDIFEKCDVFHKTGEKEAAA
jgi:hypothetical protein